MTKVSLPLVGSGLPSQTVQYNPSSLINLYVSEGFGIDTKKATQILLKTPGTRLYGLNSNMGPFQGWTKANSRLYIVMGGNLYSVLSGIFTLLGTITNTTTRVTLIDNGLELMIGSLPDSYYLTYSSNVLTKIVDPDFLGTDYINFHRGRAVYSEEGSNRVWVGDLGTFATWDSSMFQSAELISGNVVCAFATPTDLLVFGQDQTSVWLVTPNLDFPYIPNTSVAINYGCIAKFSIVNINQNIFFLAQDKKGFPIILAISSNTSYTPIIITDEAACWQLQQLSTLSDARASEIQFNGHLFYAIYFPTDNVSFLYDLATKKFIKWVSWKNDGVDPNDIPIYSHGRHLCEDSIFYEGKLLIADYRENGAILELLTTVYTDYLSGSQNSIYCEVILPVIYNLGNRQTINYLEIDSEKGIDLFSDLSYQLDPTLNQPFFIISLSKDGGRTYTYIRNVLFPTSGNYKDRVIANCWGTFRNGVFKIAFDHPSLMGIYNVWADMEIENTIKTTMTGTQS